MLKMSCPSAAEILVYNYESLTTFVDSDDRNSFPLFNSSKHFISLVRLSKLQSNCLERSAEHYI
jgi:hypothetical protein